MEIFALTPERMGLADVGPFARRVEALEFDGLVVSDGLHDAFLLAGQALSATQRLRVCTSIVVAYPRSPMISAVAAWDLQALSRGRFELGLGTQVKQNVEGRYAARWLPPVKGMREYVGSLRAIFRAFRTGEPLNFIGEHYCLTRLQPFFNPGPIDAPDPPLMLGAVGPRMLALAGEIADGVHTHPSSACPRVLREAVLPALANGGQGRADGASELRICVNELVATGPDEATVHSQRERYKSMLAFVFSTPAYWGSLDIVGSADVGEKLQMLAKEGRWSDMANALPDDVVDQFLVTSLYAHLPEVLAARFDGLADRISLPVPEDDAHDLCVAEVLPAIRAKFHPRGPKR